MTQCCSNPLCAEDADVTLQRQIDVAPVPFCHPHGVQREAVLKQALENYRLVSITRPPPSELELAQARVQELEALQPGTPDTQKLKLSEDLDTALHTLELQSQALARSRRETSDQAEAFRVLRTELERTRGELERTRDELAKARAAAPVPDGPITPPPPTRPER